MLFLLALLACTPEESLEFCDSRVKHRYDLESDEILAFPDDYWTEPDSSSPTGLRVSTSDAPWMAEVSELLAGSFEALQGASGFGRVGAAVLRFTGDIGEVPASAEASGARHAVVLTTDHQAASGQCVAPSRQLRAWLSGGETVLFKGGRTYLGPLVVSPCSDAEGVIHVTSDGAPATITGAALPAELGLAWEEVGKPSAGGAVIDHLVGAPIYRLGPLEREVIQVYEGDQRLQLARHPDLDGADSGVCPEAVSCAGPSSTSSCWSSFRSRPCWWPGRWWSPTAPRRRSCQRSRPGTATC